MGLIRGVEHVPGVKRKDRISKILAQRRSVASNDEHLGFSGPKSLQGAFVTQGHCRRIWCQSLKLLTWVIRISLLGSNIPFPLFITRAKRELIDSAVFFDFFAAGAIVALSGF